jgi:Family of unknown function (DUF6455)
VPKGVVFISSMEGGMPDGDTREQHYPAVEFVLDAIAGWINKYRHMHGVRDELGECSHEDVMRIAKDLGVPVSDLRGLAAKGPRSADVLQKMLLALSVDPQALAKDDPAVMRDLQRLCIVCSQKGRCQHELAQGTAAEHFREFCPNAYTLDALFKDKEQQSVPALMRR